MDGRFPFDATNQGQNNGRPPPNMTNAQMRAVLGMPPGVDDLNVLYLEQQRAQQEAQRDMRYRQALYQDRLDQQLQELQLRSTVAQLEDYPDLQQHYRSLLLSEQIQRRNEQEAYLRQQAEQAEVQRALQAQQQHVPVSAAAQQQHHHHHQQQPHVHPQAAHVQAARLQYQEELRRQHQQEQQQQEAIHAARMRGIPLETVSNAGANVASLAAAASMIEGRESGVHPALLAQQQALSRTGSIDLTGDAPYKNSGHVDNEDGKPRYQESSSNENGNLDKKVAARPRKRRSSSLSGTSDLQEDSERSRKPSKRYNRKQSPVLEIENEEQQDGDKDQDDDSIYDDPTGRALEQVAMAADMAVPQIVRFGTIEDLLNTAKEQEGTLDAATALSMFKSTVEWEESVAEEKEVEAVQEEEEVQDYDVPGLEMPQDPAESIVTPMMLSFVPQLPEEPVFDESLVDAEPQEDSDEKDDEDTSGDATEKEKPAPHASDDTETKSKEKQKAKTDESEIISNVLEYPYPVDTWWPSTNGRRRERRQAGETSDEEVFESDSEEGTEQTVFRAPARKIHERLAKSLEPGVLEKLPHCRVHRLKKKSAIVSELVYCWQVTECYPNDLMVNCSRCGTWRHAACGGHYKPFSNRENIESPFVAVCDNCHEEERFLKEYTKGKQRLHRQRMEQLRRGFATSSVMRNMSFSKHGGTYKWPLGSVSATHTGGHTRSVQARHDKAEKQWSDLATRLSRGYGYRAKERQRVRTKELERLLVSVEDAEGQTDRHNMLLFLMRDTQRETPVGYESYGRNLLDPAETTGTASDEDEQVDDIVTATTTTTTTSTDEMKDTTTPGRMASVASASAAAEAKASAATSMAEADVQEDETICVRPDCNRKRRFDSIFCSDACGVNVLEADLLRSFYDSSNLHPSVLRSHY